MEDFGTIKRAYTDKWGSFYDIALDDGREINGYHSIGVHTKDSGNGSTRIVTLEAYKAGLLERTPKDSPFRAVAEARVNQIQ